MLREQSNPVRLLVDLAASIVGRDTLHPQVGEDPLVQSGGQGARVVYSLVVIIPLFYNADSSGRRPPVEKEKVNRTKAEIKSWFGGYTAHRVNGWYRNQLTGVGGTDRSIVFSIDAPPEKLDVDRLRQWKRSLEVRFTQEAVYMTLAGPVLRI